MIIVEGIDGVGKSSVSSFLEEKGYQIHHLRYDEKTEEGFNKLLIQDKGNLVLDRGFITEVVYGPVLRNYSRIDEEALKRIVDKYSRKKAIIIYLSALKEDLLERRKEHLEDYEMLQRYYEELHSRYEMEMKKIEPFLPIFKINTSKESKESTQIKTYEFIRRTYEK